MRIWKHGRERQSGQSGSGAEICDQAGRTELLDLDTGERVGDVHIDGASPIVNRRRRLRLRKLVQQGVQRPGSTFTQVVPAEQRHDRVCIGPRHPETVSRETLGRHAQDRLTRNGGGRRSRALPHNRQFGRGPGPDGVRRRITRPATSCSSVASSRSDRFT
jgi:hypothetical protein